MKTHQAVIELKSERNFQYINITDKVQDIVNHSKIKNGIALIYTPHVTSSVIIQEDDSSVHRDTKETIERLIPFDRKYHHSYEGVENATAHIKNQILGNNNLTIPIKDGKILLGRWQSVFFLELLESRNRRLIVTVIGE